MLSIEFSNRQQSLKLDEPRARRVLEAVLRDGGVSEGEISVAVVDDPTIHQLNRQFLEHDYPTDVLSFVLAREGARLEGEVIASADTALRTAERLQWPAEDELLLYLVHGTLHLVGHDDATPEARGAMRAQEQHYLALVGVERREVAPGGAE